MADIQSHIAGLPIWRGSVQLDPLQGGISNQTFRAADSTGTYVVRLTRDFPFHDVYREREVAAARAAHAAGFAPAIVHAEQGLVVSRYIEGRVLTAQDVARDIPRIADFLGRFHREMPSHIGDLHFTFNVFDTNRDYVRRLQSEGRAVDATRWLTANAELEAAQKPLPRLFAHHDLLPANLIDDGKRLWLIDYEYAGFDTVMFDLANLSSNSGFTAEQAEALLHTYFCGPPDQATLRSHAAMEVASLLREALWSLVSVTQLHEIQFDYAAYANTYLERFDAGLAAFRARFGP
jgi:thiamine kinase-like enzyme